MSKLPDKKAKYYLGKITRRHFCYIRVSSLPELGFPAKENTHEALLRPFTLHGEGSKQRIHSGLLSRMLLAKHWLSLS